MRGDGGQPLPRRGRGHEPLPVSSARPNDVVRPPDVIEAVRSRALQRLPKPDRGRFSLLLIDNETGKARRVNAAPLTIELILRTNVRDRTLLIGWLLECMKIAAASLWPGFGPLPTRTTLDQNRDFRINIEGDPMDETTDGHGHFLPRWRRNRNGQSLAEYALILALIAVAAIVALLFLGGQISQMLNTIGESV